MANDFSTTIHFNSVNISDEAYDKLVEVNNGDRAGDRIFSIDSQRTYAELNIPDDLKGQIPNDSVWIQEYYCYQAPETLIVAVVTKDKVLYNFKRELEVDF